MKTEKVAVIIPFNGLSPETLYNSLKSVESQSLSPECVVIVDNSARECIDKFEISKFKLKIIIERLSPNIGAGAARNFGAKAVNHCDYFAFLDADDIWYPKKLEIQISTMQKFSSTTSSTFFDFVKNGRSSLRPVLISNSKSDDSDYLRCHLGLGSTLIISSHVFNELGGFDPNLKRFEDWDFAIRHRLKFGPINLCEQSLTSVNRIPNRNWENADSALSIIEKKYLNTLGQNSRAFRSGIAFERIVIAWRSRQIALAGIYLLQTIALDQRQLRYMWKLFKVTKK
jgi:glycosyltransferase involved in cell wall biosynthesis